MQNKIFLHLACSLLCLSILPLQAIAAGDKVPPPDVGPILAGPLPTKPMTVTPVEPVPMTTGVMTPGKAGFAELKQCLMQNDINYCHSILTPDSLLVFDRFVSYKLMPCLPTDFNYASEETVGNITTMKATMPAGGGKDYIFRIVFIDDNPAAPHISIPESFHRGLGDKWENKIQLAEQVYLMMKQNMGDKVTCDMLVGLIKK